MSRRGKSSPRGGGGQELTWGGKSSPRGGRGARAHLGGQELTLGARVHLEGVRAHLRG